MPINEFIYQYIYRRFVPVRETIQPRDWDPIGYITPRVGEDEDITIPIFVQQTENEWDEADNTESDDDDDHSGGMMVPALQGGENK